jgi:hypothetical protein
MQKGKNACGLKTGIDNRTESTLHGDDELLVFHHHKRVPCRLELIEDRKHPETN